jgi:hypothetical protein
MVLIVILSLILIWLHISSLRYIIRSATDHTVIENTEKLEEIIPESEREFSLRSFPGIVSLVLIIFLNLIEIGYFAACVYFFNNLIVIIGSAILAGYIVYSLFKFLPNIKKFYKKPSEYLKEKTSGLENVLNFTMAALEIIFCLYIVGRIIFEYRIFMKGI